MSDSDSPAMQAQILDTYNRLQVENFCIVASSVLLFFDVAITLEQEIQRIWQKRFTGATFVYLFTRYVALAERITLMVSLFLVTEDDQRCVPVLRLDDTLTDLSYVSIGGFTALRLFGIYGNAGIPVVLVFLIWLARVIISMYQQIKYIPLAFGPPLYGCGVLLIIEREMVYGLDTAANVLTLASDCILVLFTWIQTLSIRQLSRNTGLRTPVTSLLLRDGTVYFLLLLLIQIFAIVSTQIGSNFVLFDVWIYFAQVFTVIFLCRFMLNLRGVSNPNTQQTLAVPDSETLVSANRFSSSTVGNLGAPLDTVFSHNLSPISMIASKEVGSGEYHSVPCPWDETIEVRDGPSQSHLKNTQDDIEPCVNRVSTDHYVRYYASRTR